MKIPNKIKLASRVISVKYVKTLVFDEDADGVCHNKRQEIHLQQNTSSVPYPKQKTEEDFIHECLHHIFNIANMDFESKEKEEDTINRMTPFLHQFIKQIT